MRFPTWMNLDWLLPFKREEPKSELVYSHGPSFKTHEIIAREARLRTLWLIDNRQESLRAEIDKARRHKRPRKHLYAEMERLTTERMRLEQ